MGNPASPVKNNPQEPATPPGGWMRGFMAAASTSALRVSCHRKRDLMAAMAGRMTNLMKAGTLSNTSRGGVTAGLLPAALLLASGMPVCGQTYPELPELNWVQRSDWLNVKALPSTVNEGNSAKGDGIADDTQAIQAAFEEVRKSGSTYSTVYLEFKDLARGSTVILDGFYTGLPFSNGQMLFDNSSGATFMLNHVQGNIGIKGNTTDCYFDSLTYTSATGSNPFEQWAGAPGVEFDADASGDGVSSGMHDVTVTIPSGKAAAGRLCARLKAADAGN